MNKNLKVLLLKNIAIFSIYFILFLLFPNFYFEMPRVRLASVVGLIVLFDLSYIYGTGLAIFVINLFSPLGVTDYIFSSLLNIASIYVAAKYIFPRCKNSVFIASLIIVASSFTSVIAMDAHYIEPINFTSKLLHTLAGDFMVLSLYGSLLFYAIRDSKIFKFITKK